MDPRMDFRSRWAIWHRRLAASPAATLLREGTQRALNAVRLAAKQAVGLAHAAAAHLTRLRRELTPAAGDIRRRAADSLAAARDRGALWRLRLTLAAGSGTASLIGRSERWLARVQAALSGARAALRQHVDRLAEEAHGLGLRMKASTAARRTELEAPAEAAEGGQERPRAGPEGRYRIEVATPHSRTFAALGACLVAVLVALPAFGSRNLINELIFVLTMLALAQYWNLLAGYAGLVSVGQQAFVGIGGYLLFALTVHRGLDPLAAILAAGVLAAALAVPTALVVFRLRGAYFAIGTWVVAEVFRLVLAQFKALGGGTGTSLPPSVTNEVAGIAAVKAWLGVSTSAARDIITYWAALALAAGTILLVYLILRSRYGLALAAIRDSERAAESVGVDIFKTKLKVYIAAAAGTGLVGALIYLQKARISPDAAFSVLDWTANVIFIVVIGGIGTIEGPIVGVLVLYLLQTNLAHFGTWYLMLLGAFAIAVMLFAPKGIWGYLSERYGLVLFPIRRRLVANPSRGMTGVPEDAARKRGDRRRD
jgi:branched-chain amino acid transport system permease protein